MPLTNLHIGDGVVRDEIGRGRLFRTIRDAEGAYTIPYVQTSPDLTVTADFIEPTVDAYRITLLGTPGPAPVLRVTREQQHGIFRYLAPGEYALRVDTLDTEGHAIDGATVTGIGIGTIAAAIGDSITEGYHGWMCRRPTDDLHAGLFPPGCVSLDARNFPQFAPTAATHAAEFNCFEAYHTMLNDLLSASLGHPVFIANEGWGGYTTGRYLSIMQEDGNWQERMARLRPNLWLIHLGVNDGRARVDVEQFWENLRAIVRTIRSDFGAQPGRVLIARPSYDYSDGAADVLLGYIERIDALIGNWDLARGPDLFEAYSTDRERFYGTDPVHPNTEGMRLMAQLWHDAIMAAIGTGGEEPL